MGTVVRKINVFKKLQHEPFVVKSSAETCQEKRRA